MTPNGYGLGRFPAGRVEQADRAVRRKVIQEARKNKERVERDGRTYWLIRLPEGWAANYSTEEERLI